MATIKPIEGQSVHQIQSGQVIVDLNSVVKELVENSLDAGASSIEVRFKNQGLDSIEVQDNGKGIAPGDFETVALKHHTSKLSSYEDLTGLDTFGFRGEALSSLCALSRFHITTARADDGAKGKRLDFEVSGKLQGTSIVAAQRGTTVSVENLFCTLPVRRKELEKNVKREYNKVLTLLQAYACISVGVRLSITNQMPKGKKVPVFSTKANTTTKENITNVFGAKTLLALVKLDLHLEMTPNQATTQSARSWSTQAANRSCDIHVQGHISRPVFGEGRQAPDRQMFFVNSRPCLLPQISKAFNEIYKGFNVSQSPFVFANLVMDTNAYDVNVSPDKRTIMLHDQSALLESLKTALTELFEKQEHTMPQSQLPNRKLPSFKPLIVSRQQTADEGSPGNEEDEDGSDAPVNGNENRPVVSRSASSASGTPGNLILNWFGRDTEDRPIPKVPKCEKSGTDQDGGDTPTNGQQMQSHGSVGSRANTKSARAPVAEDTPDDLVGAIRYSANDVTTEQPAASRQSTALEEPDPMSTSCDDLFSQRSPLTRPDSEATRPDDDIESPASLGGEVGLPVIESNASPDSPDQPEEQEDTEYKEVSPQPSIPVITPSSQKLHPGTIQNAFDRMRPKRTSWQVAQITIGDRTTSTVIGSPAYKKRRVHEPVNSQAIGRFGSSPLLTKGLRGFAAPGTQVDFGSSAASQRGSGVRRSQGSQAESEEEEEDGEGDEGDNGDADEVMADVDAASPEVGEPVGYTAMEESDADDATHDEGNSLTSDPLDGLLPAEINDDQFDEDYFDEAEKRVHEDKKVARLIQDAEDAAARPTDQNLKRATHVLKNGNNRKESTLKLATSTITSIELIAKQAAVLAGALGNGTTDPPEVTNEGDPAIAKDELDDSNAESRLSLTVAKEDFARMTVIGQFNLGFILAVRPASNDQEDDELFIIDQHAADEKYNYERLQRTVTLQNQRLVRPKVLDLTAIEEEIVSNNASALKANGFEIDTTSDSDPNSETRPQHILLTLPMSKEKTFDLSDLEELLHQLSESPIAASGNSNNIPRPKKVQRMLAMRACRSSIMVGKTLNAAQMRKVVGHMGEMEKPWNCPHGRPTMRHLAGLGGWGLWREGRDDEDEAGDGKGKWKKWLDEME